MTKYEIILYWSDEDSAFIAEVPDCPAAPPMPRVDKRRSRMQKL